MTMNKWMRFCLSLLFFTVIGCAGEKIFTYQDFDIAQKEETRVVFVKAVVDKEYRELEKDWEKRVKNLIQESSLVFEKQFKIRFVLKEIEKCELKIKEDDIYKLTFIMSGIKNYFPITPDIDVVMVFIKPKILVLSWYGLSSGNFGNHVLMIGGGSFFIEKRLLTHEVGHLFGAIDYPYPYSPFSVMNYDWFSSWDYFDEENVKIILSNKNRDFH